MNRGRGPFGALVVLAFLFTFVYPAAQADPDKYFRQRRPSSPPPFSSVKSSPPSSPETLFGPWAKWVSPFGVVREAHWSAKPDSPLIIHLQDVHEVEEAQRNLSSLVGVIREKAGVVLVGVEGAVGPFDPSDFRASPNAKVTQSVAEALLKIGYLTGPEMAGVIARDPPTLWGIEDAGLYRENIRAFIESEKHRTNAFAAVERWEKVLNNVSERMFSPALKELQTQRLSFEVKSTTLVDYARFLWRVGSPKRAQFPQIALLLDLSERESITEIAWTPSWTKLFLVQCRRSERLFSSMKPFWMKCSRN